jgi:hypothetical protein
VQIALDLKLGPSFLKDLDEIKFWSEKNFVLTPKNGVVRGSVFNESRV